MNKYIIIVNLFILTICYVETTEDEALNKHSEGLSETEYVKIDHSHSPVKDYLLDNMNMKYTLSEDKFDPNGNTQYKDSDNIRNADETSKDLVEVIEIIGEDDNTTYKSEKRSIDTQIEKITLKSLDYGLVIENENESDEETNIQFPNFEDIISTTTDVLNIDSRSAFEEKVDDKSDNSYFVEKYVPTIRQVIELKARNDAGNTDEEALRTVLNTQNSIPGIRNIIGNNGMHGLTNRFFPIIHPAFIQRLFPIDPRISKRPVLRKNVNNNAGSDQHMLKENNRFAPRHGKTEDFNNINYFNLKPHANAYPYTPHENIPKFIPDPQIQKDVNDIPNILSNFGEARAIPKNKLGTDHLRELPQYNLRPFLALPPNPSGSIII